MIGGPRTSPPNVMLPLLSSGHELSAVVGLMRLLNLARRPIPESRMQISRVVPHDPCGERFPLAEGVEAFPLTELCAELASP
jgi:hypothetical protein